MIRTPLMMIASFVAGVSCLSVAQAGPAQDAVLTQYAEQAKAANPGFTGFSAEAGKTLYLSTHTANAETPSCTTCHTNNPQQPGQTRTGKAIEPMAISASPDRFTDMEKTEKWFGRNCASVIGRDCTAQEKGDFITYLISQ